MNRHIVEFTRQGSQRPEYLTGDASGDFRKRPTAKRVRKALSASDTVLRIGQGCPRCKGENAPKCRVCDSRGWVWAPAPEEYNEL